MSTCRRSARRSKAGPGREGKLTAQTSALYPGIRKSLFHRGHQLGMATAGDGDLALFWNKKEFATWAQLTADAEKLTTPGGKQYGIYIPTGDAEWISYDWETLLYADRGSVMNGNLAKTAFDSPAGIKALTTWVNLRRDASAVSYAQAGSYDGAPAPASGTVAMIIDGQWALPEFQRAHVALGVAPFPTGFVQFDTGRADAVGVLLFLLSLLVATAQIGVLARGPRGVPNIASALGAFLSASSSWDFRWN